MFVNGSLFAKNDQNGFAENQGIGIKRFRKALASFEACGFDVFVDVVADKVNGSFYSDTCFILPKKGGKMRNVDAVMLAMVSMGQMNPSEIGFVSFDKENCHLVDRTSEVSAIRLWWD